MNNLRRYVDKSSKPHTELPGAVREANPLLGALVDARNAGECETTPDETAAAHEKGRRDYCAWKAREDAKPTIESYAAELVQDARYVDETVSLRRRLRDEYGMSEEMLEEGLERMAEEFSQSPTAAYYGITVERAEFIELVKQRERALARAAWDEESARPAPIQAPLIVSRRPVARTALLGRPNVAARRRTSSCGSSDRPRKRADDGDPRSRGRVNNSPARGAS